jgi:hypothetical protein
MRAAATGHVRSLVLSERFEASKAVDSRNPIGPKSLACGSVEDGCRASLVALIRRRGHAKSFFVGWLRSARSLQLFEWRRIEHVQHQRSSNNRRCYL